MIEVIKYVAITILLFIAESVYFRIADHFNIIDKPNERSSHTKVVLCGGGIIFMIAAWIWIFFFGFHHIWFMLGLTLVSVVSFQDDIKPLPDMMRLFIQFVAMLLLFHQMGLVHLELWWAILIALIVFVGATNIYNFMDGINGMLAGYSLAVLVPLLLVNLLSEEPFVETSFIVVIILADLVFSYFNFRPKNKSRCFAGDVGSISMAFILLFFIGFLVMKTGDITWLVFMIVYGVDGCCTIVHRIMLHENLGEAHRKHAYQIMANELKMGHVEVSLIYMGLQLVISLVMVFLIPNTVLAHWIYLVAVGVVLVVAYLVFMKKYYHLHDEYLKSLETK